MAELAQILAHNVLDGATFQTTNEIVGHEIDRMADGYRHTWWQAPSTVQQEIEFKCANLIFNYGFENNIEDWHLIDAGAGAGTIVRNTANPIAELADVNFTTTVADNAADVVIMTNIKSLYFRAGRTYRVMIKARAITAPKTIRVGFLDANLAEDVTLYAGLVAGLVTTGGYMDITPAVDGWYHPYVRMENVGTVHFDDFVCNEVRDVDTLCIDEGHTLSFTSIRVSYRNTEVGGYAVALAPYTHPGPQPVYKTFTAQLALSWKITFIVSTAYPFIPVAQVPLLFLGERWEMPHPFLGQFDPNETSRMADTNISERGIRQDILKYNQRVFKASLPNLTPDEYASLRYFYEDTENGLKPFFLMWKPTSLPTSVVPMRVKKGELVPYSWYNRRQWTLNAEELIGKRKI